MNTAAASTPFNSAATEDRSTALMAYLTVFGFIAALIMHASRKTPLGAFHLRQMLGLMVTAIAVWIGATICVFVPFIGWLIGLASWFAMVLLWVMGLIDALNGHQKPVPVMGEYFQKWFGTAFD
jgi:uncharacterized membrane protein